jgi:acyl transferase domain-containing protein/3-hydroxymyristoyl/3-hydroxydecanoyl-(acyl carrier protein) dehydratase
MNPRERIAIVSFAGRFPGAGPDLERFWANISGTVDCARDVPPERWTLPPERCRDSRIANPDTVYSTRGYYLDPFEPDLDGLEIDPRLVSELDVLFHLVLDVGNRAWRGFNSNRLDRSRVGVVLGNICLPTDKSSELCRSLLGGKLGLASPPVHGLNRHVAGLPAGLLAKGLALGGGSYTLDAACASSLYAFKLAAEELLAGRADAMLAGGCSRPDCQYTQMGFAQLRALSVSGRCSPFDAAADGLMVGEGAGVFVLKRLSDAVADGDMIHAVIAGVGLSNDMHGNLLAPAKEGQIRAMRHAYERAGWRPQEVDLIECHATGTAVGDAIEFESLRELWGVSGWKPGRCAIGSVKSTVGHLLTGAGAAALAKVLLAMRAGLLPPQANFSRPAEGLRYSGGPFRVLNTPEPWNARGRGRRAAVSGFGFGGVNAHLLIEEYEHQKGVHTRRDTSPAVPVAIVGLATQFGPWTDTRAFQEQVLNGFPVDHSPKVNGWELANVPSPPALGIEELVFPTDRFRIPPRELEETLPQQLLMLRVAAAALDDCLDCSHRAGDAPTSGTFIGLALDPNTTNYHLRWSCLAAGKDPDVAGPPLSANRTMGALGSIAASRIARSFHFGGPSHTVCGEEGSTARAIELGVRALQRGELDRVLVGGVDLACDPRTVLPGRVELPGEGAAAFVLKRLADAERDGDRIHAVIRGVGAAANEDAALERAVIDAATHFDTAIWFDAGSDVGNCGAASAGASLAKACLTLRQQILPDHPPRYWLHDRADGPRRAWITSNGADGTHFAILLEEPTSESLDPRQTREREQPLGARDEAVFVVEGDTPSRLMSGLGNLASFVKARSGRNIEAVARAWFRDARSDRPGPLAVAFAARSCDELAEQAAFALECLGTNPDCPFPVSAKPALRDRVFYSPNPFGLEANIAFVFPGSGNQFDGMCRDLSAQWPGILRAQMAEIELLRSQFAPHLFWDGVTEDASARELMFGQVAVGSFVGDILSSLGVRPNAMIGLSLGESAGLFGVRAWRDRDEMYRRMQRSTLFNSDLAPPFNAARAHWNLSAEESVDWVSAVIAAPPESVRAALNPGLRAHLLIVNTAEECVIGGERADVSRLAAAIGKPVTLLTGVTLAHCEAGTPVEEPYRALHTLPTTQPPGIAVYSGSWGKRYTPTDRNCAYSITAGLLNSIDVPAVIESAYGDGVRIFIEVGPGASCVRAIDAILGKRPHLARAAHAAKQDAVSQILRLVAHLAAERVLVALNPLYGTETDCVGHREPESAVSNQIVIPVGRRSGFSTTPSLPPIVSRHAEPSALRSPSAALHGVMPAIDATANVQTLTMQSHETYLRLSDRFTRISADLVEFQTHLLAQWARHPMEAGSLPSDSRRASPVPRALSFEQCCAYAVGRVGDVLGPLFSEIDAFPTRVRLPDGPLQLVDRITRIEGEPLSMARGRVVTEHTVRPDRWYIESDRIPTALAVESGQADLFLAGFLGIDFKTRGRAVYRLLDAVVAFHCELPKVGEAIVYDIHIDEFTQQGDTWIFRFRFDGTIDGRPFITMRNGVAGFFTAEALAAGRGIVQTALDRRAIPGKRPPDWRDLVPFRQSALSSQQVDALRAGDLVAAFGSDFAHLPLRQPATIPGGMLRLVDRVPSIEPTGGRFGLGLIRAEFDIHPDDWFLTCHFVDDQVMPGTLMYECCLHTLRIFLMRMGWIGESSEVVCEPVPDVKSRLKCRGQVIATTRTVTYEVAIKELDYRPEPYCIADALMYADGKPIVEITDMSLRMSGLTRAKLENLWSTGRSRSPGVRVEGSRPVLYDSATILAFSNGKPSEAFGAPYRVFDSDRVIARLPGPPFQFLDRIVAVTGEPFVLKARASCEAEYDVPPDAWYFEANRSALMPFAILLEIALQPCGWLAAYCGSALVSPEDLSFRNLGGRATQHRAVTPASGTLSTTVTMTSVSHSAGMIIQHFELNVRDSVGDVYAGSTYFGFFSKAQLANQVGMREVKVPCPTDAERATAEHGILPHAAPFPAPMLRMVDRIDAYLPTGGPRGLGLVVGRIAVDPSFWFFKAHFHQDPVWPGSLGLESFLQLLKYAAWKRWGNPSENGWQTVALQRSHSWSYRGQVVPKDREVLVVLEVTAADDDNRRLTANGFLTVDGRVIYQMTDFTLE